MCDQLFRTRRGQYKSYFCHISKLKETAFNMMVKCFILVKDDPDILSSRCNVWVKWTNTLSSYRSKAIWTNYCKITKHTGLEWSFKWYSSFQFPGLHEKKALKLLSYNASSFLSRLLLRCCWAVLPGAACTVTPNTH